MNPRNSSIWYYFTIGNWSRLWLGNHANDLSGSDGFCTKCSYLQSAYQAFAGKAHIFHIKAFSTCSLYLINLSWHIKIKILRCACITTLLVVGAEKLVWRTDNMHKYYRLTCMHAKQKYFYAELHLQCLHFWHCWQFETSGTFVTSANVHQMKGDIFSLAFQKLSKGSPIESQLVAHIANNWISVDNNPAKYDAAHSIGHGANAAVEVHFMSSFPGHSPFKKLRWFCRRTNPECCG